MEFKDFAFKPQLLEGIDAMGFKNPTPIQEQSIPVILEGKDVLGSAQTGTGKTASFLLPVINDVQDNHGKLRALIVVPTRELAVQIDQQAEGFSYFTPVSSASVYGGGTGESFDYEKRALTTGAEIIIATPGRLISHMNLGYVDFSTLRFLILDEADRMLDMGFHDDIMRIIKALPRERQTLLFSATMPPKIRQLSKKILRNPVDVNIAISKPAAGIDQRAFMVHNKDKLVLATKVFPQFDSQSVIVFCSRKSSVDALVREMIRVGLDAKGIHSDLDQEERERVLQDYRNKKFTYLVATDIMSRGIDIDHIDMVMNFDVPPDAEDYVHRIGRTARAEKKGVAITFINEDDVNNFSKIERLIDREVKKFDLPEGIDKGPEYKPFRKGGGGGNKKYYHKKKGGGNWKNKNRNNGNRHKR